MTNNPSGDALVAQYLKDLEDALKPLRPDRRRQIVADVAAHIAEARARLGTDDEISVRQVLERVGDPDRIAEEAGAHRTAATRLVDGLVPWLLLLGALLFGVGWVVGIILLWNSRAWSVWQKILGTLVWPGGLVLPLLAFASPGGYRTCSGGSERITRCVTTGFHFPLWVGVPLLVVLMSAPIGVAIYLDRFRRLGGSSV
jgi:uncharacterized membrane protein